MKKQKLTIHAKQFDEIVYLFQGGGALGAFQIGVYKALEERGYAPDWIVGISIGAINASIIAGNKPQNRLKKMLQFWDMITHNMGSFAQYCHEHDESIIKIYNQFSANHALFFGQTNFFSTRPINPWFKNQDTVDRISFYDTTPLKETLLEIVDFDYLNSVKTRLSLGAVNVETGSLKFFDNRKDSIGPEHILASSALPPGFPAIKIGDSYYWDGGLYSNTPLICVMNDTPHKNRLCFLIDLLESTGLLPKNMDEVLERSKDINYAGHLEMILDHYDVQLFLQKKISEYIEGLPPQMKESPAVLELAKYAEPHNIHIAKIIYRAQPTDLNSKGYEFSTFSAEKRIKEGYEYTIRFLEQPNWWFSPDNLGNLIHKKPEDIHNIIIGNCKCK